MNKTKYIFCADDSIDRQMVYHGFESERSKEEILKQLSDLVDGEIPGLRLLTLEEFWTKICKKKVVCV